MAVDPVSRVATAEPPEPEVPAATIAACQQVQAEAQAEALAHKGPGAAGVPSGG